jgi:multidrug efflux system membrane fusion protein
MLTDRWFSGVLVCALAAGLAACGSTAASSGGTGGGGGGRGGRGGGGGPVPVVVGRVVQKDVPVDLASIGNVEAYSTISVRSQITGTLQEVRFSEGDFVKSGQLLFTVDPRPYQAALDQAQATLERDKAMLIQAQAQLEKDIASDQYNAAESKRLASLHERGLVPRDQSEQGKASADASAALVNADKASIEGAKATLIAQQASVETARLQLGYCQIRAPIDGHTGNMMIKAGNLVSANQTELITITQVTPVYVTFSLPAVHLDEIKQHSRDGSIVVTATPQTAGGQTASGKLTFIDNAVDPTTDSIKIKATFSNTDRALWPGQFARVSVRVATLSGATVAPSEAVQTGQDGQFVFLVKQDQTVEQRPIKVGQTVDQDVVITAGLRPGDQVVTEGQLRLEPGSHITRADPRTGEASPNGGRGGRGGRGGKRGAGGGGGNDAGSPSGQPPNGKQGR